jgi:hydroxymethylpyrimidine/phosphomethylpyrimidine kinase
VHGTSAITAITAQNTLEVREVYPLPAAVILAQVRTVLADIRVDAVKVGMLATIEIVRAVAQAIDELPPGTPVVVDPVMVAESGARLLESEAQSALVAEILPRASVLTPNLPEARVLAGEPAANAIANVDEDAEVEALARRVLALGPDAVVLTGGHRSRAADVFLDRHAEDTIVLIEGERHPDGAAHGSGCTHSSLLAAQLALGRSPLQAARTARALAGAAVARGLRDVGAGAGPVDVIDLERMRGDCA